MQAIQEFVHDVNCIESNFDDQTVKLMNKHRR